MGVAVDCSGAQGIEGEELAPELRQHLSDAADGAEAAPQAEEILLPRHDLQELRSQPCPLGELALIVPAGEDLQRRDRGGRGMDVGQASEEPLGRRLAPPGPTPDRPYPLQEQKAPLGPFVLNPEHGRSDPGPERRHQVLIDRRLPDRSSLQGFDHKPERARPAPDVGKARRDVRDSRRFEATAQRADLQTQLPRLSAAPGYKIDQPTCLNPAYLHGVPTVSRIVSTFDTAAARTRSSRSRCTERHWLAPALRHLHCAEVAVYELAHRAPLRLRGMEVPPSIGGAKRLSTKL
jgi:hypothetical protein